MKKKMVVIVISLLTALIIMSSGYGMWQKELTINGYITVKQDPEVIQQFQELALQQEKLQEEQKLLEEQKIQEEIRIQEEQKLQNEVLSGIIPDPTVVSEEVIVDEQNNNEIEQSGETIDESITPDNNVSEDVSDPESNETVDDLPLPSEENLSE